MSLDNKPEEKKAEDNPEGNEDPHKNTNLSTEEPVTEKPKEGVCTEDEKKQRTVIKFTEKEDKGKKLFTLFFNDPPKKNSSD